MTFQQFANHMKLAHHAAKMAHCSPEEYEQALDRAEAALKPQRAHIAAEHRAPEKSAEFLSLSMLKN